jgi:hypothetical protein
MGPQPGPQRHSGTDNGGCDGDGGYSGGADGAGTARIPQVTGPARRLAPKWWVYYPRHSYNILYYECPG